MTFLGNKTMNTSSPRPYLACLVADASVDVQEKLRDIANFVFLPLDLLMASLSFLSNLLLLTAVARMKARQHPSLMLLCSLSVSDMMWAGLCFYRDIRKVTHEFLCPPKREENTFMSIMCLFATLSNLAFISKDRFRAVGYPQWYRNHMTRSRALKEASVSWLLSTAAMMLVFVLSRKLPEKRFLVYAMGVIFYFTCFVTIIICYIGIFVASRRHKKGLYQEGIQTQLVLKREKQLAMTIGLILLILVFTFLPALASPIVLTIMGYKSKDPFRPFFTVFITLNGSMNPLINCGRNAAIRRSVRELFGCNGAARHVPTVAVAPMASGGRNKRSKQPSSNTHSTHSTSS